jgi:hypothetical protein
MRKALGLGSLLLVGVACGGVSGPPMPRLIPGGGVGDGPINGSLFVHVIDDDTRGPVANATVRVGAASDPNPCEEITSSTGLVTFDATNCPNLSGAVTITAYATTHAPSTWIGVNGTNLTMNVRAISSPVIGTASVSGTIAGWANLPPPATNHNTLGFIAASSSPALGDRENNPAQGMRDVEVLVDGVATPIPFPANACVRASWVEENVSFEVDDCDWQIVTRTGPQAHFAIIVDQDTKGTRDNDADDTFTVIGWAIKRNVDPGNNAVLSGETLDRIPDTDMQSFTASFASPPSGFNAVGGFPVLNLGGEGNISVTLPALTRESPMTRIPKPVGPLAGARYDFIGQARDAADQPLPATTTWLRNVDPSSTAQVTSWMPPPTVIAMSTGTFSFAPVSGATVHGAELQTMDGQRRWSITIFDGSSSFTLPGVTPDPLPLGTTRFVVSALKIPGADLDDIAFDQLRDKLTDLSGDEITYTR